MKELYFIFKVKDEYIPDYIKLNEKLLLVNYYLKIYKTDNNYIRKLKLENLQNNISSIDKKILEYLLDERLIDYVTKKYFDENNYGSLGMHGTSSIVGMATPGNLTLGVNVNKSRSLSKLKKLKTSKRMLKLRKGLYRPGFL